MKSMLRNHDGVDTKRQRLPCVRGNETIFLENLLMMTRRIAVKYKKNTSSAIFLQCKVRQMQFEETRVLQIRYFSVEVHCNVFSSSAVPRTIFAGYRQTGNPIQVYFIITIRKIRPLPVAWGLRLDS